MTTSIIIAKDSKIIRHDGVMKLDEPFPLFSGSKRFGGIALLMLVERKLISLHDKLNKFYPSITLDISISDLATFTCGNIFSNKSRESVIDIVKSIDGKTFENYGMFIYDNRFTMLLGDILSIVVKGPIHKWIENNIFLPLDMKNTKYIFEEVKGLLPKFPIHVSSNIGIVSTVNDILKYTSRWKELIQDSNVLYKYMYFMGHNIDRKVFHHAGHIKGYPKNHISYNDKYTIIVYDTNGILDYNMIHELWNEIYGKISPVKLHDFKRMHITDEHVSREKNILLKQGMLKSLHRDEAILQRDGDGDPIEQINKLIHNIQSGYIVPLSKDNKFYGIITTLRISDGIPYLEFIASKIDFMNKLLRNHHVKIEHIMIDDRTEEKLSGKYIINLHIIVHA